MRLPWKRRREPAAPRPDYTSIAVLEYDLFGIQPKPGTTAAAIIGIRSFGSSGLVSRPGPFLLEPGERLVPPRQRLASGGSTQDRSGGSA